MSSETGTVTVELTVAQAEALRRAEPHHTAPDAADAWVIIARVLDARCEEQAREALGLPWDLELIGPEDQCCVIVNDFELVDKRGWSQGAHLNEAQARLMSAGNELAAALEHQAGCEECQRSAGCVLFLRLRKEALTKAGRLK